MEKRNTIAIIQARMNSTRLPKKVLMEVDGIPLLKYQLKRIGASNIIDKLIVATSTKVTDNIIENFCKKNEIACYRGSEDDVLNRYYECAKKYKSDVIVRLTADCPLLDPKVIDTILKVYLTNSYDFVTNTSPIIGESTYPDGMDVEIFSFKILDKAQKEAKKPSDREHVTSFFWRKKNLFSTFRCSLKKDLSAYRITLDYTKDFEVISAIIQALHLKDPFFSMNDIIRFLDENPKIKLLNSEFKRDDRWQSLIDKKEKSASL